MWYREAKKKRTTIMVAFYVPKKLANKLELESKEMPDDMEITDAEDMHMTLAMLGEVEDSKDKRALIMECLEQFANTHGPVNGHISGMGLFNHKNSGGLSPMYASYDSPELPDFRHELIQSLSSVGAEISEDHGFTPHITVGWYDSEKSVPTKQFESLDIKFPKVSISWGGTLSHYDLKGK